MNINIIVSYQALKAHLNRLLKMRNDIVTRVVLGEDTMRDIDDDINTVIDMMNNNTEEVR